MRANTCLFSSAARGEMRYADSDVDILIDFPPDALNDAWSLGERACWGRKLEPGITPYSWCKTPFVERVTASSVQHFSSAVRIYREPGLHNDTSDGYMRRMAFMHATFAGHTSLEPGLMRFLEIKGEEAPSGRQWGADLIARAGQVAGNRPVIPPEPPVKAADGPASFARSRHIPTTISTPTMRSPAVRAAGTLAAGLPMVIAAYRRTIDS